MANYSAGSQTIPRICAPRARSNSSISWRSRYDQNVLLGAAPVGYFMDIGTHRSIFSLVWNVALLGSDRSLCSVGKANVVCRPTPWLLVGKLSVLLFRVSSPYVPETKGRNLGTMFRRILITVWAFVLGGVALLGVFPGLATRVPSPRFLFIFLLIILFISLLYGLQFLYREGMRRAKRRSPGADSFH